MHRPSLNKKLAMMFFLPSRMISIFSMLTIIPMFNVSWEIPTAILQVFFPVYIASFVIEGILSDGGFKKNLQSLGSKYTMGVPVEFVSVASFALLVFSTKPDEAFLMGIYVSIVAILCTIFVELYHHYIAPKLAKKRLSEKQMIFILIPFSVFLVFFGTYLVNSS